jgi:hypothetical protein
VNIIFSNLRNAGHTSEFVGRIEPEYLEVQHEEKVL